MRYITTLLIIYLLSGTFYIQAQHRNDYNWMIGYGILLPDFKQGGTRLDFSTDPPTQSYIELPENLDVGNASVSDSAGVLQFYTNGCSVFDTTHHIMQDGDSLNYSTGYMYESSCDYFGNSYSAHHGLVILPVPNAPKKYIIFQAKYGETDPTVLTYPIALLYTMVDMDGSNGLGSVIVKNQVLVQDTIGDLLTAVKHGNGRDWWIASPKINSDMMTLMLLTTEGIKGPYYHSTGVSWPVRFGKWEGPGASFSPDGSKYARMGRPLALGERGRLHIYDFDRCSGTFSNPKIYEFPVDEKITANDLSFSPNSHFVYVTTNEKLYQFDTNEKDLGSTRVLVGEYDGFMAPIWTTLYQMQLAPNGKIYIGASNTVHIFHTIHNPDEEGLDCQFVNHDFDLLTKNGVTMPKFPNFRLYAWEDSPCDTIGKTPSVICDSGNESIFISPNPVSQMTLLTVLSCKNGTITVFDAIGRLVYEQKEALSGQNYELDVSDWPAGVYFAVVRDGTRAKVRASRLVVVH